MLPRLPRVAHLLVLIALPGCGGPDLSAEVELHASLLNAEIEIVCECPEDVSYSRYSECVAALGEVDESDQQCMADALADEGSAAKEFIDCRNNAYTMYRDCLEANPGCQEGWYLDCAETRTTNADACTQVSDAARVDFALCV